MQDLKNLKKIVCTAGVEEKNLQALNRWWKKIFCLLEITISPGEKNSGRSLIAEFQRAANMGKIAVYRFLISLLVPEFKGLKMSSFRSKSGRKSCRNQSKSIKFVTSGVEHVHGMKK